MCSAPPSPPALGCLWGVWGVPSMGVTAQDPSPPKYHHLQEACQHTQFYTLPPCLLMCVSVWFHSPRPCPLL